MELAPLEPATVELETFPGASRAQHCTPPPPRSAIDERGRLLVANPGLAYVWVLGPRAEPEVVLTGEPGTSITNLAFGGPDRRTLFCTDSTHGRILRASMDAAGAALHRLN